MLDKTGGINQVVTPVFIPVAIAVTRCYHLGIAEQRIEINIGGRDMIGVSINGNKIFFTATA
jgi:hypothetical protein